MEDFDTLGVGAQAECQPENNLLVMCESICTHRLKQICCRTLAMIKPDAMEHFSSIVKILQDEGFIIG